MALLTETINFTGDDALLIANTYRINFQIKINTILLALGGTTATAWIKKYSDSPTICVPLVTYLDAPNGLLEMLITETQAALFKPGNYRYAIVIRLANGDIYTPIHGQITFTG